MMQTASKPATAAMCDIMFRNMVGVASIAYLILEVSDGSDRELHDLEAEGVEGQVPEEPAEAHGAGVVARLPIVHFGM